MNERARIIELVAEGKVTADEGVGLLRVLGAAPASDGFEEANYHPKFLRIVSTTPDATNGRGVNMRIPIPMLRTVAKLARMFPDAAVRKLNRILRNNGIDATLETIDPDDLDTILANLNDLVVDIETDQILKIYCE